MYCLDTDIVVAFLRGRDEATEKVARLRSSKIEIAITPLTICELYKGAFLSSDKEKNFEVVNSFIERVRILDHTLESCRIFGEDYAYLKKKGVQCQNMDLLIACICKGHNAILLTRNIKDFKNIPNLLLEKW